VVPSKDVAALERGLDTNRPEIDAAARAVRRSQALPDAATPSARVPNLMVGFDYWYLPTNTDTHHGYGAMVAINLPWLSGRRRDEIREGEQTVPAEQEATASARNAARY